MEKVQLHNKYFTSFISETDIKAKIQQIASKITQDFAQASQPPLLLVVLNGAFRFAADLVTAYNSTLQVEFIRLASYVGTERQVGQQTLLGLNTDLTERDIIIIEDIVDTGLTLHHLLDTLSKKQVHQVKVASLLSKPSCYQVPVQIDYVGFEISDRFVVGYGLDYNQLGRELNSIYVLEE